MVCFDTNTFPKFVSFVFALLHRGHKLYLYFKQRKQRAGEHFAKQEGRKFSGST